MLYLNQKIADEIRRHGEQDYPHECGGLLVGRFDAATNGKIVTELLPMKNSSAEDTQHNRVLILPQDVLRAERYALGKKLDVVGFYHSHPDDAARPSKFDLDHALPVWSYIIVSVENGAAVDLRSWELRADRSQFDEEVFLVNGES